MNREVKLFEGEKWLVVTGLLGFILAGVCGIWVLFNGGPIGQEGDVSKAFSFNAALGIFLLSTAAILPFSAMRSKGKAFFRWTYILLALYSHFAETVQHFRGINPRFGQNGTLFDVVIAAGFGLVAILLVLFYFILAVQYFRKKAYSLNPGLVVSIRYSMIAVMISFAAGIWISVIQSRYTDLGGNIIWLHGAGFHALQALPFVAWLSERRLLHDSDRHRLIHISGTAYILGLVAIGWQTVQGAPILELSIFPLLAAGCFLIAIMPVVLIMRQTGYMKRDAGIE